MVLATLVFMKRAFGKRALLVAVSLVGIASLGGCPIYSHDDDGCWHDRDCADGYSCDENTGDCYLASSPSNGRCSVPSDCGVNQTCTASGVCKSGDCSFNGCPAGYLCDSSSGVFACIVSVNSGGVAGAGGGGSAGSGAAGSAPLDSAGSAGEAGGG